MDVAHRFAQLSTAKKLQVGAIIVKDDRIISIGYNGMPSGWTNECEDRNWMDCDAGGWLDIEEIESRWPYEEYSDIDKTAIVGRYNLKTKDEVIHAEANAIAKLAKSPESGVGSVLFLTHSPCIQCAKQIYTAGIEKVFYKEEYRSNAGVEFLKKCNIEIVKV